MREINTMLYRERCILLDVSGMPRFQIRREKRVVHERKGKTSKPKRERKKKKHISGNWKSQVTLFSRRPLNIKQVSLFLRDNSRQKYAWEAQKESPDRRR